MTPSLDTALHMPLFERGVAPSRRQQRIILRCAPRTHALEQPHLATHLQKRAPYARKPLPPAPEARSRTQCHSASVSREWLHARLLRQSLLGMTFRRGQTGYRAHRSELPPYSFRSRPEAATLAGVQGREGGVCSEVDRVLLSDRAPPQLGETPPLR